MKIIKVSQNLNVLLLNAVFLLSNMATTSYRALRTNDLVSLLLRCIVEWKLAEILEGRTRIDFKIALQCLRLLSTRDFHILSGLVSVLVEVLVPFP